MGNYIYISEEDYKYILEDNFEMIAFSSAYAMPLFYYHIYCNYLTP